METMRLDEIIDAIYDHMKTTLDAYIAEVDSPLDYVKSVIDNRKAKPRPELPSLWIFIDEALTENNPKTLAETWTIPVQIVGIIKDLDMSIGRTQSNKMVLLARSKILKDRTLGNRRYVQDTVSKKFTPSAPYNNEKSLHASIVTLEVTVTFLER